MLPLSWSHRVASFIQSHIISREANFVLNYILLCSWCLVMHLHDCAGVQNILDVNRQLSIIYCHPLLWYIFYELNIYHKLLDHELIHLAYKITLKIIIFCSSLSELKFPMMDFYKRELSEFYAVLFLTIRYFQVPEKWLILYLVTFRSFIINNALF